ncbi:MAG TPA: T9SS type A sorting domain-containing protein [Bacteroidales bacterium]|nr:T9SS type A sorting domain-containing protein [Bacteroidales bacterium]
MKKQLFFTVISLFSFFLFSQNLINTENIVYKKSIDYKHYYTKTPTDTIFIDDFFNVGQPSIYGYNPYGYIFGTGWDAAGGPKAPEIAQGYIMNFTGGYNIEEAMIWVAAKDKVSATGSDLTVKVAKIDGTSTYGPSGGPTNTISCPGTVLGTTTILWNDIDTGNNINDAITIATFNPSIYVTSDYAIVVNFDQFYTNNDTIGIVCSADGGGSAINGIEYTWWKYRPASGNPFWTQLSHVFSSSGNPLDVGIAIFPIVNASAGVVDGSDKFINGIQLGQNSPNPAIVNTTIPYAIEKNSNVKMEIFDIKGHLVMTINEGFKKAGHYTITISNELAPGTYYYSLVTDNNRLTKKMTLIK